jgi:CheY-like chemotaxis protein
MKERRITGFSGEKQKILIVDDEELNRQLLAEILQPLGFNLEEAIDGQDALDKTLAFSPDLILMDLIMSGLDGFEVVRRIRQNHAFQHIRIIAVSASAFKHTRRKSLNAGCDDFIVKPLKIKELLEKLQQLLPIEWLYENPKSVDVSGKELLIPSHDILQPLHVLATKGHLRKLLDDLDKLEHSFPQFSPFTAKARRLAREFQMDQLCKFLARSLEEHCF